MNTTELKEATAQQGFTQFTMNNVNNSARMFLDIHMETYTTIGAFSGGYYGKSNGDETITGWDQQWSNISIGSNETDDMTIDGLVFMADFDDAQNLQRVIIGSNRLQGKLTATFNSYSGTYNAALLPGGNWEAVPTMNRGIIGTVGSPTTFQFKSDDYPDKDMGMFFIFNVNAPQQGMQVVAGFDEKSLAQNPWWDSP